MTKPEQFKAERNRHRKIEQTVLKPRICNGCPLKLRVIELPVGTLEC